MNNKDIAMNNSCGPDRTRTCDLSDVSRALYQLSYESKNSVREDGIGPSTSFLSGRRSTTEPLALYYLILIFPSFIIFSIIALLFLLLSLYSSFLASIIFPNSCTNTSLNGRVNLVYFDFPLLCSSSLLSKSIVDPT